MDGNSAMPGSAKTTAGDAALKAFATARAQGRSSVECYRAGVAAWRHVHPEYAAKRAVAVILSNYVNLRVEA
jgi:sugar/nucleoside kinase (ribokinase family)